MEDDVLEFGVCVFSWMIGFMGSEKPKRLFNLGRFVIIMNRRGIDDKNILDRFCIDFCGVIEKHCEYIVVSGFVVIASGRARGTEDIDIIIERIGKDRFVKLHNALTKKGFVCIQSDDPEEIYGYVKDKLSVRYTYEDKPLPEIELKMSKDELDEYQLKTKTKLPLTGLDIWFSSVNMNIAFKEELLKTDKDIEDAKYLRTIYDEEIDKKEINKIKAMIRRYRL